MTGIRTGKGKVVLELRQDKHVAFEAEAEVQFDWMGVRYHGIWSHHSQKQWKQCQTSFLGAPKSLQIVTAAMKLKDTCSLEEKL